MDKGVFSKCRSKDLGTVCLIMAALLLDCSLASSPGDEGKALMAIKASFSNLANVLLDWNDAQDSDFCAWRGVLCDNNSLSVASLNLCNLNPVGEMLAAIGDLRNLQSMFDFTTGK